MKKKLLIGFLVFALVLFAGSYIFIRSSFFTNRVRSMVESILEERLGREVSVGKISGSFFRNISIDDIAIAAEDRLSDGKFVDIAGIKARYSLFSLLRWKFVIKSVEIIRPQIWLERDEEGMLNIPEMAAAAEKDEKKPSRFSVLVSNIKILAGNVMFEDKSSSTQLAAIGIDGILRGKGSITDYSGEINVQNIGLTAREVSKNISDTKASFEISESEIILSDFQFRLDQSHLQAKAKVSIGDVLKVYSEIKSTLFLEDFKEFVATPAPRLAGIADIYVVVEGEAEDIGGACVLSIPTMNVNDLEIRNVDAEVKFTPSSINLTYLSVDLTEGGARISGEAQLDNGKLSRYDAELRADNLNVAEIMTGLNGADAPVSGSLSGQFSVKGTEPRPGRIDINGHLSVLDTQLNRQEFPPMDIGNVEANLSIKGEAIAMHVFRGKTRADLSGTLNEDGRIDLRTEVDVPDIEEITSLLGGSAQIMGSGNISVNASVEIAHPAFRAIMELPPADSYLSIAPAIASIKSQANVDMPELSLAMDSESKAVQVGSLTGNIDILDERISFDNMMLQLDESRLFAQGGIHLKEDSKHEIDADLTLNSLKVENYVPLVLEQEQMANLKVHGGLVEGKLKIYGDPTNINGGGEISVRDLSVGGRDIELINIPAEIKSSALNIPNLVVSSLDERISMSFSLTPTRDYELRVDSSLIELSKLSPDTSYISGTAQISIAGSGNIDSPSLKGKLALEDLGYKGESFGSGSVDFVLKDEKAHADISIPDQGFIATLDSSTQTPFPFSAIIQLGNIDLKPALNLAGLGDKMDLRIAGNIDVDGEAATPMKSSASIMLQTVLLDIQESRWRNDGTLKLRFDDGKLQMDSFIIKGAGGILSIDGTFDTAGDMDLRVNVEDFDLAVASKLMEQPPAVAGNLDYALELGGSITAPSMEMKLDVSELIYDQLGIDSISAQILYADGFMKIDESTLKAFGGEVTLKAEMPIELDLRNLPTPDQLAENSINMFLDGKDINLNFIPSVSPELLESGGLLDDIHLEMTGQLKQPAISGSMRIKDARFLPNSVPIAIEDANGGLLIASRNHKSISDTMEYEASMNLSWDIDGGIYDAQFTVVDDSFWVLNAWNQMIGIESPVAKIDGPDFHLDLEVRSGKIETLLKAAPDANIPPIDGTFSSKVRLDAEMGEWINESSDPFAMMNAPLSGNVVINSLDVTIDGHKVKNSGNIKASLADGTLRISDFQLMFPPVSTGETPAQPGLAKVSGRISSDKTLDITAFGEHLDLGFLASMADMSVLESGEIAFGVNAAGRLDSPIFAFNLTAEDLKLSVSAANGETKIDGILFRAGYRDEIFNIAELHVDSFDNQLDVDGTVPIKISAMPVIVEPLDGEMDIKLTMDRFDLSVLNYLTDKVKEARGFMKATDVTMRGSPMAPFLTGNLHLSDASFQLMVDKPMPPQEGAVREQQPLDVENATMDINVSDGNIITGSISFEIGQGLYKTNGRLEIGEQLRPGTFDFKFSASPASIDPFIKLAGPDLPPLLSGEIRVDGQLRGDASDFQGKPVLDILRSISGEIQIPSGGVKVDAAQHRISNPNQIYAELQDGKLNMRSLKLIDETAQGSRASSISAFGSWEIDGEKSFDATLNLDMSLVSKLMRQPDLMSGWLAFRFQGRGDEITCIWPPPNTSDNQSFSIGHATMDRFEGNITYRLQELNIEQVRVTSGQNQIVLRGKIPMTGKEMDLRLDARLDDMSILSSINRDITGSSGRGVMGATITGDMRKVIAKERPVQFAGSCNFSDLNVNFYESNMNFENLKADVVFNFGLSDPNSGFVEIRDLSGRMNDGVFALNRNSSTPARVEMAWEKNATDETGKYKMGELKNISVSLTDCAFFQPMVFSIMFGGELILSGKFDSPVISGNIAVTEGKYTESLRDLIQRLLSSREIGFKAFLDYPLVQDLQLNISVQIPGKMMMNNTLVNAEAEAFANVSGSLAKPIVAARGDIVTGEFRYLGREFTITEGEVINKAEINPEYKIKAETRVTNTGDIDINVPQGSTFKVIMELNGSLSNISLPDFYVSGSGVGQEQQNLSRTDIISILTLGTTPEAFLDKSLSSSSSSSSPWLMKPAKWYIEKKAEELLNLKEFEIQIDPNSSKETRLVVAKEVMEQISVLVDVGYGGQQWFGLQREMGRHFAFDGKVSQYGGWSFDLKLKRDFP